MSNRRPDLLFCLRMNTLRRVPSPIPLGHSRTCVVTVEAELSCQQTEPPNQTRQSLSPKQRAVHDLSAAGSAVVLGADRSSGPLFGGIAMLIPRSAAGSGPPAVVLSCLQCRPRPPTCSHGLGGLACSGRPGHMRWARAAGAPAGERWVRPAQPLTIARLGRCEVAVGRSSRPVGDDEGPPGGVEAGVWWVGTGQG